MTNSLRASTSFVLFPAERENEISRFAGLCGSHEDKSGVIPHRLEPVTNVGDVVGQVVGRRYAQLTADVAGADLCDQFANW